MNSFTLPAACVASSLRRVRRPQLANLGRLILGTSNDDFLTQPRSSNR